MNIYRIKEIQKETSYPESVSVQQALLKVWNECNQEQEQENISSWSALTNLGYLRCNNGSLTGDISSWPAFVIDAVQRAISESIIEYISQHPTEQPSNTRELSAEEIIKISEKYANEHGGSMFGLAYKSFRAGIEYIIKNRKE